MGETGQPLHRRINGHRFNITHEKTEESPVAEHTNGEGHTLVDVTVMAIDKMYTTTTHVFAKYGKAGGSGP